MSSVVSRWVPEFLIEEQMGKRVDDCRQLLGMWKHYKGFLDCLFTMKPGYTFASQNHESRACSGRDPTNPNRPGQKPFLQQGREWLLFLG